jgi:hypothetical protein
VPKEIIVSEVLDRYANGEKVSPKEAQAVVAAASMIRKEFLDVTSQTLATADRRHHDYQVFLGVLLSMGDLLGRHGVVTGKEMSDRWAEAEMVR